MLLKDKTALITGGDNAIGKATAWAMVRAGAKVILTMPKENCGEEFVRAVTLQGKKAIYQIVNITMSGELDILFDRINREFGRLDIAFNNTQVAIEKKFLTGLDEGDVAETIDVNVYGTWLAMKYEIEQMLTNKGGVIVNNSGILGVHSQPKKSVESATRAAIISMTKAAALEYAKSRIRINTIAPGFIESDRESNNGNESINSLDLVPMGRLGKPEEVAKAVVWLCSDEASFTTGHVFPIDGGFCR